MRIKSNKITLNPKFQSSEGISSEDVEKNRAHIERYIQSSRNHLESLKTKIYKMMDASGLDASVYYVSGAPVVALEIYAKPLSEFITKAYATETFDNKGEGIENRDQDYITAGKFFADYCNDNRTKPGVLNPDLALFDDIGKMIAAINLPLSMLNKMEAKLIKAQKDPGEYEYVGGLLPQMPMCINVALDVAKKSKIVTLVPEQTMLEQASSGLSDVTRSMKKFFSHLGKSEDDIFKNRFQKIKGKYGAPDEKNDDEMTEDDISEPDSPKPK